MQSSPVCPNCGCLCPSGVCPVCGAVGRPSMLQGSQPAISTRSTIWLILACFLISGLALSVSSYVVIRNWARRRHAAVAALRHVGPVASLAELKGNGRIYVAQLGDHNAAYSLDDFAQWLHTKYGLDVQVLPPVPADRTGWDSGRRQWVAELLYAQLKRDHPDLAADQNAYLIGFTDGNMYSVDNDWDYSFTQRDMQRAAVISAHGMEDGWLDRPKGASLASQHLQIRLRRILLKDVAIL